MVRQALRKCRRLLVIIGSATAPRTMHDPLDITYRTMLMRQMIAECFPEDVERIQIITLADLTFVNNDKPQDMPAWGKYLYDAVVEATEKKKFIYFTGERREGVVAWFREVAEWVEVKRLVLDDVPSYLSATLVREAFAANDREFVERHCPASVAERFAEIRDKILEVV